MFDLSPALDEGSLNVVNEERLHTEKEGNTMTVITKPTDQAFVLNAKKSETFLKQDNSQFRSIMAKFEKYTGKSHGISTKK